MAPLPARFEPDNRGKCQLAAFHILADPLADRGLGALRVEDVVGDLEGEPEGPAKRRKHGELIVAGRHRQATQFQGSTEQCAGLAPVDPFQPRHLLGGRGCRQIADPPAFRRQIVGLPAHERLAAGRPCQHEAAACGGRGRHALRECLKGQSLQGITAEDGGRLVKLAVAGGPASAEVIIIHRRQVIMHERVGVDHLNGQGRRRGRFPRLLARSPRTVARACGRGPEHQGRPQPLAGRQQGIPHRINEAGRCVGRHLDRRVETGIDEAADPLQGAHHRRIEIRSIAHFDHGITMIGVERER